MIEYIFCSLAIPEGIIIRGRSVSSPTPCWIQTHAGSIPPSATNWPVALTLGLDEYRHNVLMLAYDRTGRERYGGAVLDLKCVEVYNNLYSWLNHKSSRANICCTYFTILLVGVLRNRTWADALTLRSDSWVSWCLSLLWDPAPSLSETSSLRFTDPGDELASILQQML